MHPVPSSSTHRPHRTPKPTDVGTCNRAPRHHRTDQQHRRHGVGANPICNSRKHRCNRQNVSCTGNPTHSHRWCVQPSCSLVATVNDKTQNNAPTNTTMRTHKPGTQWECSKCAATYSTPQPAKAVLCATCNKRLGVNRVWMKPVPITPTQP